MFTWIPIRSENTNQTETRLQHTHNIHTTTSCVLFSIFFHLCVCVCVCVCVCGKERPSSTDDDVMPRKIRIGEENHLAVIGDEDTVVGFLLAGIGHMDAKKNKNFFIVNRNTQVSEIEKAFKEYTSSKDIAIVLINQHIAEEIRHLVNAYEEMLPTILEIPSKNTPYDPEKDSILRRVQALLNVHD